jgi:hypothetical protein
VRPIHEPAQIDAVCRDPYISERVRHDHREPGFIDNPYCHYFGAFVDDELVGVFLAIESGDVEWDVHAYLKREAVLHSRVLGLMFLALIFAKKPVNRVTAYILQGLDSAMNYVRKLGFVHEGVRRGALMRDGELIDVHIFGLTRGEYVSNR